MAEKRILIADADIKAWDEFRRAMGEGWIVVGASTASAAITEAQKQSFDVVVANHDLPGSGGAELLNRLRAINPKSIRFIAAEETSKEKVMCHVLGGHQFLAMPFDPTLKSSIERSLAQDYGMSSSMRDLVGRIRTFPTIPSLYTEVVNALKNPNATTEEIGAIIAKDMAMTTKLVRVLNSAYFGLSRTITDPTEAVGILGFETVKSLIMTIKVLSQYDKVKPVYFSVDNIWRHSTNVARTARVMALLEIGDNDCSATAYTAGLMHDLGKVILAANFDSQYHGAHNVARKQQIPLWEVEKDIFGATHGEIGAYLLGLWGMSSEVVRVAALHHHPLRGGDTGFTALTAVHVANVLEHIECPETDGLVPATMDMEYLTQMGLEQRVELWREARREPDPGKLETRFETKAQRAKKNTGKLAARSTPVGGPASDSETVAVAAFPKRAAFRNWRRWLVIGFGAAAACAGLARLEFMRLDSIVSTSDIPETVEKSPAPARVGVAGVVVPPRVVEEARPPAPVLTNIIPITAAETQPTLPPATNTAPVQSPPKPPTIPVKLAVKTPLDRLRLQAIFFTSASPSALINGQLASVGEQVSDCRILSISPSSVTLEHEQQRKTLTLR